MEPKLQNPPNIEKGKAKKEITSRKEMTSLLQERYPGMRSVIKQPAFRTIFNTFFISDINLRFKS